MRIALYADIHANREAFAACLADARARGVDRSVLLGDLVGYGADPEWVIDRAAEMIADGALAVLGNHDAAVFGSTERMNEEARAVIGWTRERLSFDQRALLERLPLTVEDGGVLYVHADATAPADWVYVTTRQLAWRSIEATDCRLSFVGHVHQPALYTMAMDGKIGEFTPVAGAPIPLLRQRRWLAVLGAVGQPRDANPAACYGLFDDVAGTLTYVRVPYDVDAAANKIRAAGLPLTLAARLERGI